jgi:phage terminase large subunit GpA-like protein
MAEIFPENLAKNKANTLKQKMLIGCTLHTLGGKAAKNYRRISVDEGSLDEISGFDANIENEGDCFTLAGKRTTTYQSRGMLVVESSPGRNLTA